MTRTVLVHDYLLVMRGAERTFAEMAACWPQAPISTLLADDHVLSRSFAGREVRSSRLQALHPRQSWFRALLPVLPAAASRLQVADADVVVSSSSAFALGVRPRPGVPHVCYCHSPFRYAWHEQERTVASAPAVVRPFMRRLLSAVRSWDLSAAARVTRFVANSEMTRGRIAEFYGREARVIHPPVAVDRFSPGTPGDAFLVVGEVTAHKRTEAALEAARVAGVPIRVVGTGPALDELRARFCGAEFLGRVGDDELPALYAGARAVVVPNVEEFGIVAVEAQAAGRPVLGVSAGGTLETVIPGQTGVLVEMGDVSALAEAMLHADFSQYSVERCVTNAQRFRPQRFREQLLSEVDRVTADAAVGGVGARGHRS